MNKDIWRELAEIREIFMQYPTQRLVSSESRGGYIVEDENQDYEVINDDYYNSYCRLGSAKYQDE